MPLGIGETAEVQGSAKAPYIVKNVDGTVWSCTCPGWRNSPGAVDQKICKHVRQLRGPTRDEALARARSCEPAPSVLAGPGRKLRQDEKVKLYGPKIMLANRWDGETDPTGFWMSEKLDGVRALYHEGRFISRQGNTFNAPEWFKEGLVGCLDGELWMGRKRFPQTISVVKTLNAGDEWRKIRFRIFDAPQHTGTFEQRIQHCRSVVAGAPFAGVLDQVECTGVDHLKRALAVVEAEGGEGIMLRRPGSEYESGKSHNLLKVKTFFDDEAEVIGYVKGKGKYKGMTGGLECRLPNGVTFSVGSGLTDDQRRDPPKIGTRITFRYQELSQSDSGVPRFPVFVSARDYE